MEHYTDIFAYILAQEASYKLPIQLNDKNWSMKDHIRTSELYNNSDINAEKTDFTPIKNITRPILNLQHRTEDIEVKDVQIYVDDAEKYHLSFLVKKYHDDVFVVENDIDTYFDELNVSRIDFGGGLSKKLYKPRPEVVPLQSIVFCDQTDMLSGPIGIKHYYSPDQLLEMESKGWGSEANGATASLDEVITLSREEKKEDSNGRVNSTPGRYIEVYEVHGNVPIRFANPDDDTNKYETRLFICCFYQKKGASEKQGIILYTALEPKSPFKLVKRDPVYGRALGFGGAEELFEAQVWVNYDMIRMQAMLDAASKTIILSEDPAFTQKNKTLNIQDTLPVLDVTQGLKVYQMDTFPRNMKLFETSVDRWEAHAQQMGAANDAIMGENPSAGTPFKLQELVTSESHGLHDYRRGQYAKHLEEIYVDWIIPHIVRQITKGATFLSELSLEDLQYVADNLVQSETEKAKKNYVLSNAGIAPTPEMVTAFEDQVKEQFKKKGSKHFIEILKNEFKNTPLAVKVNIAGKQKNLAGAVDKITNIFRFAFSNPQGFAQVMQIPGMAKSFNEILEYSGLSPADFSGIEKLAQPPPQPAPPQQGQPASPIPQPAPQPQNAY